MVGEYKDMLSGLCWAGDERKPYMQKWHLGTSYENGRN